MQTRVPQPAFDRRPRRCGRPRTARARSHLYRYPRHTESFLAAALSA